MSVLFKNALILSGNDVIKDGFLGIEGENIDYIGKTRPEKSYDVERDMSGRLLMPGLINAHTHTPMTLLRGVGSGLNLQQWLFDTVFPIEDRLTREQIKAGVELAVLEMLATGTTSFTDMYMEPEAAIETVLKSGMKANICRPVQCFDPEEKPEDNFRVKESVELYNKNNGAGNGRVHVDFSIHAEYTCTEAVTRYYSSIVNGYSGRLHIHLSETKKEHDECVEKYGMTPAEWFNSLGAFDSHAFLAHCVYVTEGDLDIIKSKNAAIVHNPTSNMKLGSGFAPVSEMLDKGITVALGTDGAASNNNLNMFEELHLASVLHNGYHGDPTIMRPDDLIKMATINGAAVQGRTDTGVLLQGKKADIIALDMTKPHLVPNLDTKALVCYSAQGADVAMTMVNGKILYENGEYLTMDKEQVYRDVERAVAELYR